MQKAWRVLTGTLCVVAALTACQAESPSSRFEGPAFEPTPDILPEPSATPTVPPTPAPTPVPTPTPTPTIPEAQRGTEPFPAAPAAGTVLPLSGIKVESFHGLDTAFGAIDGRLSTQWSARQGVGESVFLLLDLNRPETVAAVDLLADATPATECVFAVDASLDRTAWVTLGSGRALGSNLRPAWGTAQFQPIQTRYLRVRPSNWGRSWVAVWELQLRR